MKVNLKKLYKRIPQFECKEGCTDCCGMVPWTKRELDKIPNTIQPRIRKQYGIDCPYISNGKCIVYEQRPLMCRLFGTVDSPLLICPHKYGPKKKLSDKEAKAMIEKYQLLKPILL